MKKKDCNKQIGVLISGGVDSSVAAYLLSQEECSVHGVFITIWNPPHIPCTAAADRQDAMRACAALGIPFLEYDATKVYREKVIEPFVEAYHRGETPNPDVLCNQFVKFDALYTFLREKGFGYIATGHYARVKNVNGNRRLYRSVDEDKDQTYFIYTISQEALDHTLFPVGGYTKSQVRSIASAAGLPAAQKKDSVGLCFLGDVSMRDFLSAYIEPKEGQVHLFDSGEVVGTHDGAWFYTIGQQHGFTVISADRGPYVIVRKDVEDNVLFVRKGRDVGGTRKFHLVSTLFRRAPDRKEVLHARYRHRGDLYPVSCSVGNDGTAEVMFTNSHSIASGQSIVLYGEDGECLGGGVVGGLGGVLKRGGGG